MQHDVRLRAAAQAWRVEVTMRLRKLARLAGMDVDRLLLFEAGRALPAGDELPAIAAALRVVPELLVLPGLEPADGDGG